MELNVKWVKPAHGGRRGGGVATKGIAIAHNEYKGKDGKIVQATSIRLGVDVMNACRFVVGDRVVFGFAEQDEAKYLVLKRVAQSHEGFTLSNPRGKAAHGESGVYAVLKMKRQGIPAGQIDIDKINIEGATLFFDLSDVEASNEDA